MSTTVALHRLEELAAERAAASLVGLDHDPSYMAQLAEEIAEWRAAYVSSAVSEIAILRADMGARLQG